MGAPKLCKLGNNISGKSKIFQSRYWFICASSKASLTALPSSAGGWLAFRLLTVAILVQTTKHRNDQWRIFMWLWNFTQHWRTFSGTRCQLNCWHKPGTILLTFYDNSWLFDNCPRTQKPKKIAKLLEQSRQGQLYL